jgi:CBS domain-containing protein
LKALCHVGHCSLADHARLILLKRILLGMEKNASYMDRLAGLKQIKSRERWEGTMSIESILRRKGTEVTTIAPEASTKSAVDWLRAKNIGALVVASGNAVLGLISEREIVHAFSRYGETAASMPVKEIMQYGVTTVSPDESVNRVMNLMTRHRVRHMPVLRGGNLAGIVSIGDVVKYRLEELELETNVLRDVYNAAR